MQFISFSLLLGLAGYSSQAFAYLDPGTGSMIISAVVGIFATLVLAIKTYWYKLLGLFRRKAPASDWARPDTDQDESGR